MRADAPTRKLLASMPMCAQNVATICTLPTNARQRLEEWRWENCPRHARCLVWTNNDPTHTTLAAYTESMPALPSAPTNELNNPVAHTMIRLHPHLFQLITPINIDFLESLLTTHPNQVLVRSIILSFRQGFWPFAITENTPHPSIVDNSARIIQDPAHVLFVHKQRDYKIQQGHFSPSFGQHLLPGMTAILIGIVPKPHSNKLQLVVDQSSGDFAPNSFIPWQSVAVPLDNLQDLGAILHCVRVEHGPSTKLVVFKSDVSQAYQHLPVHSLWQLFQIITIDGECHVDRNNNFSNRGAGGLWGTFMGIVLWITINVKHILDLLAYVDDTFSWEFADNFLWYEPYACHFPAKQALLLQLWDELGIPHEQSKQVFGLRLTIVGLDVDTDAMTVTMPVQSRCDLVEAIRAFANVGQRHSLREFQRLAGWMNWALNAYPLLRLSMSLLYSKMAGKVNAHQLIWVSKALCRELIWFTNHVKISDGIYIMTSVGWGKNDADFSIFCNACPSGMGFWYPARCLGFVFPLDLMTSSPSIFYFEALTVVSTIYWAARNLPLQPCSQLAIYTDNSNTVDMFNTLRMQPLYNPLLITVVEILLLSKTHLRVFHVPGDKNIVADRLSCSHYDSVFHLVPTLQIYNFIPPRLTLGAEVL